MLISRLKNVIEQKTVKLDVGGGVLLGFSYLFL